MKHFSRIDQLPGATASVQLSYCWGESVERPFQWIDIVDIIEPANITEKVADVSASTDAMHIRPKGYPGNTDLGQ